MMNDLRKFLKYCLNCDFWDLADFWNKSHVADQARNDEH